MTALRAGTANRRAFRLWCLLLVVALLLASAPAGRAAAPQADTVQPLLLELAAAQPDASVSVIVQKLTTDYQIEQLVSTLGGIVTRDLRFINAFAAELPAGAIPQLAEASGVRWISLNAPVHETQTNEVGDAYISTTWATRLGHEGKTEFVESHKLVDSQAGPNGQYAFGSDDKAYVSGFTPQIVPEHTIVKVEVVLFGFAAVPLRNDDETEITVYFDEDGDNESDSDGKMKFGPRVFDGHMGAANAGPIYIDVTQTNADWDWMDLTNGLEIKIDHSHFESKHYVYYDAIGLRVTSVYSPVFTTWASELGTKVTSTFSLPEYMIDAPVGPAGTFGYGSRTKISLAGFEAEITPGYVIRKVEVVINGYANRLFDKRVKFQIFVNNKEVGKFEPRGWIFSNNIGISNSGSIYVDITGDRKWQWGDFEQDFQLVIDQSDLENAHIVHYDAVGLRVTTKPGIDPTGNTPDGTLLPDTAIDPSQQVNVYNKVIGAELLWNENRKLQGKDIGVAVVDSGVYKTGDLSGAKVIGVNFNKGYHDSKDRYGHGTFVASVIAGNGKKSSGRHIGVAPKARILNVRVSDDMGSATEADVVAGLQWVYENKDKYNIRVVNLSLNASVADSYLTSPLCAAVEMLWLRGVVVVVSAGNNGTATLYPPANDPFVITVGATDDRGTASLIDDVVASFSAYGLTEAGFAKPDLVAPGRNIIAFTPGNKDLTIGVRHPGHRVTKNYFRMSGTSMSAPMVTGAVALLLQAEPALTPDQVKHRLLTTANKNWPGYDPVRAGAGYLNIYSAVYTPTYERANAGVPVSQLLWESMAGTAWSSVNWNSVNWNSVNWNSVNWNSVNWNSVNWNSVNWNSVNWNSVNWNSDYWEDDIVGGASYDRLLELLADEPFDPPTNSSENLLFLPVVTR